MLERFLAAALLSDAIPERKPPVEKKPHIVGASSVVHWQCVSPWRHPPPGFNRLALYWGSHTEGMPRRISFFDWPAVEGEEAPHWKPIMGGLPMSERGLVVGDTCSTGKRYERVLADIQVSVKP